jgi:uncharacterized protein
MTDGIPAGRGRAEELINWFRGKGGVLVAFSGGVDSAVVAKAAAVALGKRAVAATATSPTFPRRELEAAREVAREIGITHVLFTEDEFQEERFIENPPDRCYFCRKGLVEGLKRVAEEVSCETIVDGANADDLTAHRPGIQAMREAGVRSPLIDLGIGKGEVRTLAGIFGLSVQAKPSMACLASRIPYGERISREKLARIEEAESYLQELGIEQARVRLHGTVARIEVLPPDLPRILDRREEIVQAFRRIGFTYVSLDLEGYRSGSLDEVLKTPLPTREGKG